jgi:uncharacterized membrane protein YcaP (DUF421 family)
MAEVGEFLARLLGIGVEAKDLTVLHVVSRTVLVLGYSLFLLKIAHKRFMSRKTRFDFVVAFILASVLARAINGSAPLVPSLVAGIVIVGIQRALDYLAFNYKGIEEFLKGRSTVLGGAGKLDHEALKQHKISLEDLQEDMRLAAETDYLEDIRQIRLERNGSMSFIKEKEPGGGG